MHIFSPCHSLYEKEDSFMKRIIYKIQKRLTRDSGKNINYIIMKEMLKIFIVCLVNKNSMEIYQIGM